MPKRKAKRGAARPARPRKDLAKEERTLEHIDALSPLGRAVVLPVYLAGAFWPWWLTFAAIAVVVMLILPGAALPRFAALVLGAAAASGYGLKKLVEWLAPTWVALAGK